MFHFLLFSFVEKSVTLSDVPSMTIYVPYRHVALEDAYVYIEMLMIHLSEIRQAILHYDYFSVVLNFN